VRINENVTSFQALRSHVRDTSNDRVGRSSDTGAGRVSGDREPAAPADASVLDRVATENAAAALSRLRDTSLAQQLADMTASQIVRNSEAALATQAHVAPETVVALLQT